MVLRVQEKRTAQERCRGKGHRKGKGLAGQTKFIVIDVSSIIHLSPFSIQFSIRQSTHVVSY